MGPYTRRLLSGTAAFALMAYGASAARAARTALDLPAQPLEIALNTVGVETRSEVLFSKDAVSGHEAPALHGTYEPGEALVALLSGTDLTVQKTANNVFVIAPPRRDVRAQMAAATEARPTPSPTAVETVVVTAQKKQENIQTVPIAVSAFSQKQLTERQVATGGDLIRETPNMNFGKTNFSGYSIELRGIGTQAISVTTDPAVAVAFNGIPFIRNHFFEQEFYDLDNVEVLRGPQGTLYGRNATAGVVNLVSAKPTDEYEANLSADFGNYSSRRFEGMVNLAIVPDKLELRLAGEWTKRDGYAFDTTTNRSIDGRDLWSGRATLAFNPTSDLQTTLVWEHYSEDDDRLRSGKQLCKTSQPPTSVDGVPVPPPNLNVNGLSGQLNADYLSQGCELTSLYSPSAFEVPYGFSLPYALALGVADGANPNIDPFAGTTQSRNLRQIQSTLRPNYRAKNDTIEFNAVYSINPALSLTSETGYNQDFLWSTEDYNRFDTSPGIFTAGGSLPPSGEFGRFFNDPTAGTNGIPADAAIFCDPQLGCSDRLVGEDLSEEHSWQLSQEFRLASNFSGPFNFSVGANYLHYETEENYYVFLNALSAYTVLVGDHFGNRSSPDNSDCLQGQFHLGGFQYPNPTFGGGEPTQTCVYLDTNPIGSLNNKGHNYFLSQNPYTLNSYAEFGEFYYNIADDLKFTGGLRWTVDQKHFTDIPSQAITQQSGYPVTGVVNQEWDRFTGRAVLNWTPHLDFTDQSMFYASYAHGYKAGGANPPGAEFGQYAAGTVPFVDHPATFKPEYIEALELGTKNTLLDGELTLNADIFYYNYTGYQISEIVDRTAINTNYNAHVEGAELESVWEPLPGLKFNFAGGLEDTGVAGGQSAIDLMDRTAGMPGWMVVKPFPTQASNCILPTYVVAAGIETGDQGASSACGVAYNLFDDPITGLPYVPNPTIAGGPTSAFGNATFPVPAGYPGFNPLSAPNNGEGFSKNLHGHQLPNSPPFTLSFGSQYTLPVSADWAATLRGDFYWQGNSWARILNDKPYDQLHGYTNLNLALILNSTDGWQVMGYIKNVFNTTAITGDFLNSDDSGLTTNAFLTDPRLIGVRVTKDFEAGEGNGGYGVPEFLQGLFSDADNGRPTLWIDFGGDVDRIVGQGQPFTPAFLSVNKNSSVLKGPSPRQAQNPLPYNFDEDVRVAFQPQDSDWVFSAAVRFGRSGDRKVVHHQTDGIHFSQYNSGVPQGSAFATENFSDTRVENREHHTVVDFSVGKDVGLGMFGLDGSSIVSGGVRIAQFSSSLSVDMRARPDLHFKYYHFTNVELKVPLFHTYHVSGNASRKFHGIGPSISWAASTPIEGAPGDGEITLDWGANAAILFGRQVSRVQHHESAHYANLYRLFVGGYQATPYNSSGGHNSSRRVAVPNLGAFAGATYRFSNAKIAFGYRADFFFNAIDVGIDKPKSGTLGFYGPFAKISLGFGG